MDNYIYLLIFILVELQGHHHHHHQHHHHQHSGIYSGSISNFHVVVPKIVSLEEKAPMSNKDHLINKRQIPSPDQHRLQMQLEVDGRTQTLDLWRSDQFFADQLRIERVGYQSSDTPIAAYNCHYRGTIIGQKGSVVALSMCNGIVGFIRTNKSSYWIEPSRVRSNVSSERPHLLYKRSAVENVRHRKRKKKKKADEECGTRDHRNFVTRTRLQWQRRKGSKVKVQGRKKSKRKRFPPNTNRNRGDKKRPKRSISRKHNVECLVVADSSMIEFYKEEELETYLLTIMNMVNVMYHDVSIGNYINIVVVRILLLEDEAAQGLNVTVDADVTLDRFCRWQQSINHKSDAHPLHHDVAILITRQDICSGSSIPCSTLGVAHVAGMCHPNLSCSVNEDNGLTLAHTIAHELGHNFGMYHDTENSGCSGKDGETLHVMTTSFEADILHVAWSPCSRRDITNFFDAGNGECLYDEPTSVVLRTYPELPIGAMYNAEYQCKIQFAVENTSVCTPMDEVCSRLWCIVDGVCTTRLQPAAPGTNCGKHKWCSDQSCVRMAESARGMRVDGGWGAWQEWGVCSRSCGGGVTLQRRACDHPSPQNGGAYCLGERTRYRICNTQMCQSSTPSFRAEQCSAFNGKMFNAGQNVTWLPFFDSSEPCQLFCTDADETVIMPMGVDVKDGTPCRLGRRDMCIAGLCRKVGCDWKLDSILIEDRCGNCLGDSNTCTFHENYYNKSYGVGYVKIVRIPRYARNVIVQELGNTFNYIGVGSAVRNNFYLNGDKAITLPGEYTIANSQALYERDKEKERIHILGPIQDDIIIYLIFQDNHKNQGVHYQYTMPVNETSKAAGSRKRYFWRETDEWSACSVTCGQGERRLAVVCHDSTNQSAVADKLCDVSIRPTDTVRSCSMQPCLYRWWSGPWQVCPVTCGDYAQRHRTVLCVTNDAQRIAQPDSACAQQLKPPRSQPCAGLPPCMFVASRKHFHDNSRRLRLKHAPLVDRRLNFENSLSSTSGWRSMPWSRCSKNCGLGFKKRTVLCSKPDLGCELKSKPIDVKQCFKKCL